jgi:DNA-binding transcriptional ArsR family regulator
MDTPSRLLVNGRHALYSPLLASQIGRSEATILQQANYWISVNGGQIIDGVKWFWKTYEQWAEELALSVSTVRRAIAKLKNLGLIAVEKPSAKTYYQANWYTLNKEAIMALNEQIEAISLNTTNCSKEAVHSIDSSSENYSSSLLEEKIENKNLSEEIVENTSFKVDISADNPDPSGAQSSGASLEVPKKRTKDKDKEAWEISPSHPYPVFLNWRADKHYKPQGGKWESDAYGIAYCEFYNNRAKTTAVLFPQFLEYMKTVAENCNQQLANGIKAILSSCFIARPEASQENMQQLMANVVAITLPLYGVVS